MPELGQTPQEALEIFLNQPPPPPPPQPPPQNNQNPLQNFSDISNDYQNINIIKGGADIKKRRRKRKSSKRKSSKRKSVKRKSVKRKKRSRTSK